MDRESSVKIANKIRSRLQVICLMRFCPNSGVFNTFGHPIGKYIVNNQFKIYIHCKINNFNVNYIIFNSLTLDSQIHSLTAKIITFKIGQYHVKKVNFKINNRWQHGRIFWRLLRDIFFYLTNIYYGIRMVLSNIDPYIHMQDISLN